jgi:hypothetical protein
MHSVITKIAAARDARSRRLAEQGHALWEERRRIARRCVPSDPCRFRLG